ncbi:urease subunit beta [Rubritalea marina]|uniref:urease subunit beta n=1 Tax=Rubritalea marina TaxID=361055 RepID=UPI00036DD01F|nr:urease subunit beta [Rubritalea marina]
MIPGEIICADAEELVANTELNTQVIEVSNTGDRPIQIGSHYHFFEANNALTFDRPSTLGFRLNIPAGTAVRFEPGDTREVELVALAGKLEAWGHQARVNGPINQ